MRRTAALACVLAVTLAGCGDRLSASQLRSKASAACATVQRELERIATPSTPDQAQAYLDRGLGALRPAAAELRRLKPPSSLDSSYRAALALGDQVIARIAATAAALRAGQDATAAIRALNGELEPLLARASDRWRALGVAACVSR